MRPFVPRLRRGVPRTYLTGLICPLISIGRSLLLFRLANCDGVGRPGHPLTRGKVCWGSVPAGVHLNTATLPCQSAVVVISVCVRVCRSLRGKCWKDWDVWVCLGWCVGVIDRYLWVCFSVLRSLAVVFFFSDYFLYVCLSF